METDQLIRTLAADNVHRARPVGFVLALAAIKFQYLLPLALLLAFARKWRVVLGLTIGGIVLVTISALVVGVRGIPACLRFLHDFNSHFGYGSLNPTLMVNLRGFIAGFGGGLHGSGSASALAGGLLFLASGIAVARWATGAQNHAVAFAIYITVALLAAPYAHFADATMLLLPILLVTNVFPAGSYWIGRDDPVTSRINSHSSLSEVLVPLPTL